MLIPSDRRYLTVVILAGIVGGALAYFSGLASRELRLPVLGDSAPAVIVAHALLGGFSGFIYVALVSNTDRTDTVRLVALACLAGFLWSNVVDVSKQMILTGEDRFAASGVRNFADKLVAQATSEGMEISQTDFTALLDKYSSAVAEIKNPDILTGLSHSPALKDAVTMASEQPWYSGYAEKLRMKDPEFEKLERTILAPNM